MKSIINGVLKECNSISYEIYVPIEIGVRPENTFSREDSQLDSIFAIRIRQRDQVLREGLLLVGGLIMVFLTLQPAFSDRETTTFIETERFLR